MLNKINFTTYLRSEVNYFHDEIGMFLINELKVLNSKFKKYFFSCELLMQLIKSRNFENCEDETLFY